jgi:GTP cyclohydrolase I
MTGKDTHVSEQAVTETADADAIDDSIDWEKAQRGTRLLLEAMGEDPQCDHLEATWQRRVPELVETFSEGQRESDKPTMRTFPAEGEDLVIKTGIPVHSLCEHHLLPFHGAAHVAYRPGEEVVGLSKLVRYVRWQSRQLTMQEQLTSDIAHGLADELGAAVVLVEVSATHMCEAMRGVETETETTTRTTVGTPTAPERERFTDAIRNTNQ